MSEVGAVLFITHRILLKAADSRTAWLWEIISKNGCDHQHFLSQGSLSVKHALWEVQS